MGRDLHCFNSLLLRPLLPLYPPFLSSRSLV
jgi:hypothetical protein